MTTARIFLGVLLLGLSMFYMPSTQAYETEKVLILALNPTNGAPNDAIAAMITKLGTQFKFPKYEILKSAVPLPTGVDRTALEKLAEASGAEDIIVLEIRRFRSGIIVSTNDDQCEEATVSLSLNYFSTKTGQFGRFSTERTTDQVASIYSGALPLSLQLLDELLSKLDPLFPRQFTGTRY